MISIPFSRIIASLVYSSAMAFSLVTAHLATPFQLGLCSRKESSTCWQTTSFRSKPCIKLYGRRWWRRRRSGRNLPRALWNFSLWLEGPLMIVSTALSAQNRIVVAIIRSKEILRLWRRTRSKGFSQKAESERGDGVHHKQQPGKREVVYRVPSQDRHHYLPLGHVMKNFFLSSENRKE